VTIQRVLSGVVALALSTGGLLVASPAAAADGHTVTPLDLTVQVGPTGTDSCSVVADLYTPVDATPESPAPAILTTNGFGGSKDDQAGMAAAYADRGYVVLSYSGLGFGGSGCRIELDAPDYDGKAAQQLIDYLAALDYVRLDAPGDPRVGMVGGSYGGAIQLATASIDDRLDAIVPMITWHDLRYSLSPNNLVTSAAQPATPGAAKLVWALGFSLLGVTGGLQNAPVDPGRLLGCPNFAAFVCPSLVLAGTTGFIDEAGAAELMSRSAAGYGSTIEAPTLLIQGESDTLFNLNEGLRNYRMLSELGTEVKMIWGNGGHSGPWADGELDLAADPDATYTGRRVADWFDHYLKDLPVDTGPEFAYFRDWVDYTGNAEPAFGTADTVDVGEPTTYYLSGADLVPEAADVTAGSASFLVPPAGLPTSLDPADVIGDLTDEYVSIPEVDLPGTAVTFTTAPLDADLDVVGSPVATLQVSAPAAAATQALGPAGQLVLFFKISEVAPDGASTIVRNLVAPVRIPDVTQPFSVEMPAIVHRFDNGSRLRLTVSAGSLNYRGGLLDVTPVTIVTGSASQQLTLPTVHPVAVDDPTPDEDTPDQNAPDENTADDASTEGSSLDRVVAAPVGSGTGSGGSSDALPGAGSPASLGVLLLALGLIGGGSAAFSRRFTG